MRHDGLVLILLWRELVAGLRAMRRRDLAWIAFGGGGLLAYAVADIVVALGAAASCFSSMQQRVADEAGFGRDLASYQAEATAPLSMLAAVKKFSPKPLIT